MLLLSEFVQKSCEFPLDSNQIQTLSKIAKYLMVHKGQLVVTSKEPKERLLKLILGKALLTIPNPKYGKRKSTFLTQDTYAVDDLMNVQQAKKGKKIRVSTEQQKSQAFYAGLLDASNLRHKFAQENPLFRQSLGQMKFNSSKVYINKVQSELRNSIWRIPNENA